jgi:hypothetical protein
LAEVVRLSGLRQWIEQGYKQVKQELGWADFQVRSDRAIRRHWALVCCAFCFCWWAQSRQEERRGRAPAGAPPPATTSLPLVQEVGAGGKGGLVTSNDLTQRIHGLLVAARAAPVPSLIPSLIPSPILAPRTAAHPELA